MKNEPDQAKNILVLDDDPEILELLSNWLTQHDFSVKTAANGASMRRLLDEEPDGIALVLLDVMLPDADGIDLCKEITVNYPQLPVILMTANKSESDRVLGLEFGADDYIQKPFNPRELLARVKAIFRRIQHAVDSQGTKLENLKSKSGETVYGFSGWQLDTGSRELKDSDGVEVSLTSGVYDILLIFLEHPRRVLTRNFLMDLTQNRLAEAYDRSIDVQVSRLRQKLDDDPSSPALIKTIRNGGYMFTSEVSKL